MKSPAISVAYQPNLLILGLQALSWILFDEVLIYKLSFETCQLNKNSVFRKLVFLILGVVSHHIHSKIRQITEEG
jgi:hypothetical protein